MNVQNVTPATAPVFPPIPTTAQLQAAFLKSVCSCVTGAPPCPTCSQGMAAYPGQPITPQQYAANAQQVTQQIAQKNQYHQYPGVLVRTQPINLTKNPGGGQVIVRGVSNKVKALIADRKLRGQLLTSPGGAHMLAHGKNRKEVKRLAKQHERLTTSSINSAVQKYGRYTKKQRIAAMNRSVAKAQAAGGWTTSGSTQYYITSGSTNATNATIYKGTIGSSSVVYYDGFTLDPSKLQAGHTYILPDGAKIVVDDNGNYTIEDKDAKVWYRASTSRAFNPYLNSSDLLAKFVEYCRSLGVSAKETTKLPVALFINWLIIRASEADHEPVPADITPVPQHRLLLERIEPRCLACERPLPREYAEKQFMFCDPRCAMKHYYNQKLDPTPFWAMERPEVVREGNRLWLREAPAPAAENSPMEVAVA